MANYTVTTTNKQEDALTFLLAAVNARRAAHVPADLPLTSDELVQDEFKQWTVSRWVEDYKDFQRKDIGELYSEANATKRAQVDAILKG